MGLEQATVREIVDKAVTHKWGIPEFQRGFVWTPQKVRDLVDSLWRGYPIGSYLIWYGEDYQEPRTQDDAQAPDAWVVDGQQRTTAFCLLFGRKPYWWDEGWGDALQRHDLRFNVLAEDEPFFSLQSAAMRGPAGRPWVPIREVLTADDERLGEMVTRLLEDLGLPGSKFGMLWPRLDRVRQIRQAQIPVVTVMLDLEDVTEIFARLNSAGTKVTEADIALALAASQNPGWARDEFLPFLKELEGAGFELDPNLVFRSCVGIGLGKARLKDVPRAYWKSAGLRDAWKRTARAWQELAQYVEARGILSADILPTKTALVPLTILADRFPDTLGTEGPMMWLLHATRSGRYSGSALTALEQDLQAIQAAPSGGEALSLLRGRLGEWVPLSAGDLLQDYRDRFLRLLLYLVVWSRGARDWVSRQRLGFQGTELLERFSPDWHHIFPRAYLRNQGVPEARWDLFANIAVISPAANIRFGARNPMAYLERYRVDAALLEEQLVPSDGQLLDVERYEEFLTHRAEALAQAVNAYVGGLERGERWVPPPVVSPEPAPSRQPTRQKRTESRGGGFFDRWAESFGPEAVAACRAVLDGLERANIAGVVVKLTKRARPVVYLRDSIVGRASVLRATNNKAAIRDALPSVRKWPSREEARQAYERLRQDLAQLPGASTGKSHVYLPVDRLKDHVGRLVDAVRAFAVALNAK